MTEKKILGDAGEQAAVEWLQAEGYELLERNWRAHHHEVDAVMRKDGWLVFVEVKTRASDWFCDPVQAITDEKLWNLVEASRVYKQEHPWAYGLTFRIDAMLMTGEPGRFKVEHLVDPFRRRIATGRPWKAHHYHVRGQHAGYYRKGY